MKNLLLHVQFVLICLGISGSLLAQPAIQWEKTLGGAQSDKLTAIKQTPDKGFIAVGQSQSGKSSDKTQDSYGSDDLWVVKTSADGTRQWDLTLGGSGAEIGAFVELTQDGGYIVGTTSTSGIGPVKSQPAYGTDPQEMYDYWIIKLSASGAIEWEKTIGGPGRDFLESLKASGDGGYILGGRSRSPIGGNKTKAPYVLYYGQVYAYDHWIVKLSSVGKVQWDLVLRRQKAEYNLDSYGTKVELDFDGGYVVGGYQGPEENYLGDYYLAKLNRNGVVQWQKTYGGPHYDQLESVLPINGGGYLLGGWSYSGIGGDKTQPSSYGQPDYWVIKTDEFGNKLWDKTYGGSGDNRSYLHAMAQASNGDFLLGGASTAGTGRHKSQPSRGSDDFWLIKINREGTKIWDKTIGGTGSDNLSALMVTADEGMIIGGVSNSPAGPEKSQDSRGGNDFWIVKLAREQPPIPDTPLRINAGGAAFTTATQKLFIADQYYSGDDRVSSIDSGDILNTTNNVLYRSARCSPAFSYNIPVVNGTMDVILHFAETYFGAPGKKGGVGSRRFHVNIEGYRYLTNYDIFSAAGGAMRATSIGFNVAVADGMLSIDFLSGVADMPRVSAIEVIQITPYCTVGNLKTQQDVNAFRSTYNDCKVLKGDLTINTTNILNLDPLSNLNTITGSVRISHNPDLTSLAGLSGLQQVGGEIIIEDNSKLATLQGLENLTSVKGDVRVVSNQILNSISALSGLVTIPGSLSVGTNPALTSLKGLDNLTTVQGSISIAALDLVPDLKPLSKLTSIGNSFLLVKNNLLNDLTGLQNLESAGQRLEITGNSNLLSLSGLTKLSFVQTIKVDNNPRLSDCLVQAVCSRIGTDALSIYSNAPGCNTIAEAGYACSSPSTTVRINAGGIAFMTATKKLFSPDQYYAGIDRTNSIAGGDILNTTNDVLYQSARSSPAFSYNIPVASGTVYVTLHFAETYFGTPGKEGGAGSRQFHVDVEGSRKLTNYDIFAAAGGAMRAVQLTIPVTVTDGLLNIDFLAGAADLPRVCAIEVIAPTLTLNTVADAYVRDGRYREANYGNNSALEVKTFSSDPSVFRSSYLKFNVPVATTVVSARLRVYGHNHEDAKSIPLHAYGIDDDSWTEEGINKNNAPAASTPSLGFTAVNAIYQYYEIDVTSYVKAQLQSGNPQVSMLLSDPGNRNTRLIFNSRQAGSHPPQLFIQSVNTGARMGQDELASAVPEKQHSTVYPNPAKDHFTVSISSDHGGAVSFELVNASGKSHPIPAPRNANPGEDARVDLAGRSLSAGMYLLKIKSDALTENVKMLITE
ncbi:malectin domain-containing carbohydrate-binding protein [Dyadobacter sandarakinus]|uniref:DNRLRE domain-containing protein n=1 Tax=Dyadobacter sandarakinus TaxID=2747268 RepID=A0ABX7I5L4_9BACT|nr:malectin domain-containing carbohydrate-binding protein [Dyadobacter sandarakinus]QRR01391.1 DNRLRE domain-containing protein [Dyadobacter sandarakinus]